MLKSLYTTATGMKAQQTMVDMIANNIANVNTSGFKKSQASFEDLLYVTQQAPGLARGTGDLAVPTGTQIGSGTRLNGTTKVYSSGMLEPTERPLDVAIDGEGFFAVRLPDGGTGYTRDGSFQVNANGNLVTSQGHILLTEITVPADTLDISIDSSGRVFVARASVPDTSVEVGRIVLARFPSPQFVASVSATSFAATAASGEPILCEPGQHGVGILRQRCLENSNAIQLREVEALREVDERLVALHARLGWLRPPTASSDRTAASK